MREILGFVTLMAIGYLALWVVAQVWGFLYPILTHPIATIIFIGLFVLFAVRLFKASQR
jgi:hypothetical protein